MLGVGAALAVFVYIGATTTDRHVGELMTIVQSALKADMEWEWIDDVSTIGINGPGIAGIPAAIAFLLLLFGGLPLAVFGLLLERQWKGVSSEQRRYLHVPYAVLVFQIVSMTLSVFWIVVTAPYSRWTLPYLSIQILGSIAVIPVWRRLVNASALTVSILRP
jgi:hypothetical protein